MRAAVLVAALAAGCWVPVDPDAEGGGTRVVMLVIDGARYTETLGDPAATWTPRLAALAREGCAPGPLLHAGTTYTAESLGTLHTGVWDAIAWEGAWGEGGYFDHPTHWEYFREATGAAADQAWYVLPDYDEPWTASPDPDFGPSTWPTTLATGWSDADVVDALLDLLEDPAPRFAVAYLPDTDGAGHAGDWDTYTATIAEADRLVGVVWDRLGEIPGYAGNTVFLVTGDHGRHDDDHGGFEGHGCDCDGCTRVTFLAAGAGVDPDCVPERPWAQVDVVPTLGRVLGFTPRDADGAVMEGLFATR